MSDRPSHVIRFSEFPTRKRTQFLLTPDAPARTALAKALEVLDLRKLRVEGVLVPAGKKDWRIEATLGATVSQACVVTLDPVTTRVDEDFVRLYSAQTDDPDEMELEVPADDTPEPLPETLDLYDVVIEALTLALPAYPRKDGVDGGTVSFTEPGKAPMTDADARPFAGLAALRDSLENKDDDDS